MIGSFGVLSTGLVVKRIPDITGQIGTSLQGDLGAAFSLIDNTPEGQLVLRLAEQVADLWEFGEQVYNSYYPDSANGTGLDAARSMVNIFRIPQTNSVVNGVVITGTPGTPVPAGFQLSVVGSPNSVFQIAAATTIGGGGTVTAAFVCTAPGPTDAPIGTLTNIVTPVSGIASATNPAAVQLGTFAETDAAFRLRSAQELSRTGTGTFSGLLQAVQQVANVSQAFMFINDTDTTDSNGLLPHSVLLVVVGGVDADIRAAIFASKGAGIQTNGTDTGTVVDSQGISHTVNFDRLTQVPIYIIANITRNTNPALGPVYPANGDTLVTNAIVNYGAAYVPGQTVLRAGLTAAATILGVTAVDIRLGTSPSPSGTSDIAIPVSEIAQFIGANVTVNS